MAGLQRWLTLVPGITVEAADPTRLVSATERFSFWHTVLGTAVGETLGYALTATFTVLVVVALQRRGLPHWLGLAGFLAAALIATGVLVPVLEHGEPDQLRRVRALVRLAPDHRGDLDAHAPIGLAGIRTLQQIP